MSRIQAAQEKLSYEKPTPSFAADVAKGLSSDPKYLLSKYFYDVKGDFLFRQIMQLDEYYLTPCEFEILEKHKDALLAYFNQGSIPFELVEFGAGDGFKTKILLRHFLESKANFEYIPIDISQNALDVLTADLDREFPSIKRTGLRGDYFECLSSLNDLYHKRKAVLFLGSNIGNFANDEAATFLKQVRENLNRGDMALIGFDMKKDPDVILKAYNDPYGVTAEFNMNLLDRINRELDANFDRRFFKHFSMYEPLTGEARSFLVSVCAQAVYVGAAEREFHFEAWEAIHTEISRKYTLAQIREMADAAGFRMVDNFFDEKKYFVDSLWRAE